MIDFSNCRHALASRSYISAAGCNDTLRATIMRNVLADRPKTRGFLVALGVLVLLVVLFALFFDWNYFRPTLARIIAEKTGRHTVIRGNLRVHLWSFEPRAEIGGLTMDNPAWAQRSVMFSADELTVSVRLGRLLRGQIVIPEIKVVRPAIDVERDAKGRASWEFGSQDGRPQKSSRPAKIPTIRRLLIESGTIRVSDGIRKLKLDGTLNASDVAGQESGGFELKCKGSLNDKPFQADLHGGPLINLDPDHPYQLTAHLNAADIKVDARTSFPKPFDMAQYSVKFEVSGNDLADVFYLTGLALPNTPPYRLSADVEHRGTLFHMGNLKGKLGASDIEGMVEIETGRARPKFIAKLRSDTLDMVDLAPTLGHPAAPANTLSAQTPPPATKHAQRAAPPAAPAATPDAQPPASQWLFPDADLQVNRVRGMDADVTYQARSVVAPKMPMKEVRFHLLLNGGLLKLDPLSFVLDAGKFAGNVTIDAAKDVPESTIDMAIDAVDLSQFTSAKLKQPPLQGSLTGRLKVHGFGTSVHKLAASADGTVSVALPTGQMSEPLAELTGIDIVKGLGLLFSQKQPNVAIRCGVIDFQAQKGELEARSVFIDTTNVLITGRGHVDLGDERLDLSLQGDPKKVRLFRLRSPITLHGTLLHPAVGVKAENLVAQAGVAAALGTLLTPFAAALAFIDPGLAKNKDCSAVMAEVQADVSDQTPPPAQAVPPAQAAPPQNTRPQNVPPHATPQAASPNGHP
jgi:AsmA family protein